MFISVSFRLFFFFCFILSLYFSFHSFLNAFLASSSPSVALHLRMHCLFHLHVLCFSVATQQTLLRSDAVFLTVCPLDLCKMYPIVIRLAASNLFRGFSYVRQKCKVMVDTEKCTLKNLCIAHLLH